MIRTLLASSALVAFGLSAVSVQAATLREGRSAYMHSHHHAAHHYRMTHSGKHTSDAISHGRGDHRTTATGGNPGGFSSRN